MSWKLLDLFCGAGGCSMGYHKAGFEVTGVDIEPQPNYPFSFHQADAIEFAQLRSSEYDAIHASPPCQKYSRLKHMNTQREDLIIPIRQALILLNKPYVIENVLGAPLKNPVVLCGTQFGLQIWRHRIFECNKELSNPPACNHSLPAMNIYNKVGIARIRAEYGPGKDVEFYWKNHMGVEWMKRRNEWRESIPPAYTEFIGIQLIEVLNNEAVERRLTNASFNGQKT